MEYVSHFAETMGKITTLIQQNKLNKYLQVSMVSRFLESTYPYLMLNHVIAYNFINIVNDQHSVLQFPTLLPSGQSCNLA